MRGWRLIAQPVSWDRFVGVAPPDRRYCPNDHRRRQAKQNDEKVPVKAAQPVAWDAFVTVEANGLYLAAHFAFLTMPLMTSKRCVWTRSRYCNSRRPVAEPKTVTNIGSVVLVPPDALDVVPRRRLMARVTLVDLSMLPPRYLHRHHLKVHHVMTRRCLVALGAVGGTGRRVSELGNRPSRRRVTLSAVRAEKLPVAILVAVAGIAV